MSVTARRIICFVLVPLLLVAALGLVALGGVWSFLTPIPYDTPTQLASVPLPNGPSSLAWSPDGSYVAAGAWGANGETNPGEVLVVDVAKGSVLTSLKGKSWVEGLAFSPDGNWLAVAARPSIPVAGEPAELVVFDVPAFTAGFTAKARVPDGGFIDLAWSADSKSLYAIDGPVDYAPGTAEVRRWAVPAFTEHQHAIRATQDRAFTALAASPDGRALAIAERIRLPRVVRMIRLFDLGEGTERLSFKAGDDIEGTRLGFTPDGKSVGVLEGKGISWWDLTTGRTVKPGVARFASQPAGMSYIRSWNSVSPDGGWQARGYERHRGFGDLGWDNRDKEFGTFIDVTERATAKTRTWRVSKVQLDSPAVAFSPDGSKLAGVVKQPGGASTLIFWAVPK